LWTYGLTKFVDVRTLNKKVMFWMNAWLTAFVQMFLNWFEVKMTNTFFVIHCGRQ